MTTASKNVNIIIASRRHRRGVFLSSKKRIFKAFSGLRKHCAATEFRTKIHARLCINMQTRVCFLCIHAMPCPGETTCLYTLFSWTNYFVCGLARGVFFNDEFLLKCHFLVKTSIQKSNVGRYNFIFLARV